MKKMTSPPLPPSSDVMVCVSYVSPEYMNWLAILSDVVPPWLEPSIQVLPKIISELFNVSPPGPRPDKK